MVRAQLPGWGQLWPGRRDLWGFRPGSGGPNCKTNVPNGGTSLSNYQWTCYNPDALNANHTEWNGFSNFEHMCRRDEEIKTIISTCQCKRYGGCPPYGL